MEEASEAGLGVLLYSFQDLTWTCFNTIVYWMRKYMWTVDHAVAVMTVGCLTTTSDAPTSPLVIMHAVKHQVSSS